MGKKKILFVVDTADWAFHNIVKELISRVDKDCDAYVDFAQLFTYQPVKKLSWIVFFLKNGKGAGLFFLALFFKRFRKAIPFYMPGRDKVTHYVPHFWSSVYEGDKLAKRKVLPYYRKYDVIIHMDYYYQYSSLLPHQAHKHIVGIFTEGYPHNGINYDAFKNVDVYQLVREDFFQKYISHYNALFVGSVNLFNIYKNYCNNIYFVNAIYKQDQFKQWQSDGKFFKEELVFGWTGNPEREFKGFQTIILPAINAVKSTGRKIILKTQFAGSYESLLSFYDDVACVLIASSADAGPSMFAEASLCGVPSISTRVGFPLMVIDDKINGIFIEREIASLAKEIINICDNRTLLLNMAKRIREDYLKVLGNEVLVKNFKKAINDICFALI